VRGPAVLLSLLSLACSGAAEPTPFGLGERFPIGPYEVAVARHDEVDLPAEDRGVVVFLSLRVADPEALEITLEGGGVISDRARERRDAMLRKWLRLIDGRGEEERPITYVRRTTYDGWITRRTGSTAEAFEEVSRMREAASYVRGEPEESWAILFVVPDDWRDLSVRLENVEAGEGQPRAAIVALGS
jgi:hypothetical protein